MSITIKSLEIENVKRIKAVELTPSPTGLTVIGGKNGQGKTSVLDSIAWALGGERYRPSNATREGSTIPPTLKITMANGLIVERKGKNSDLKVTDPEGKRAGQQLLNEFVEQFALDLPKFMNASAKEKADTLLKIIGVGDTLFALERQETEKYNRRHTIGQLAEQKKKYAAENGQNGGSARCYGEGNKVTMQLPAPNSIVAAQSQIVLYADREPPDEPTEMPDLVGLTYDLARQRLGFDALFICTNSRSATDSQTVVVSRQSIAPGEMVEFGTVVEVSLVDTDVNASAQN